MRKQIIVTVVLCFIVFAIITSCANQDSSTTATSTAQTQAQAQDTPTPSFNDRIKGDINDGMQGMVGSVKRVSPGAWTKAWIDLGDTHLVEPVKLICFSVQRDLWTHEEKILTETTLQFQASMVNAHSGQPVHGANVATCDLGKNKAQAMPWFSISQDDAWGMYNQAYLAPGMTS